MSKILPSLVLLALIPNAAVAQITPDSSLGAENSIVESNGDRDTIEGGAIRDTNLFHSFQEFNVGAGREAYFANPNGIANIFSRVTGNNLSNILGTLGVLGDANLFFMNPNGIVFGANARLDVRGSFLATTAESMMFSNGYEFSTINSQTPPLLTVNIPIGLNFRSNHQGTISNAGNLGVDPGNTLTLSGGTVTNTGSLIAPGGTVMMLGERVGLLENAQIDVSSETGGGTVLIGGGFNSHELLVGQRNVSKAQKTSIEPNAIVKADGIGSSDGGQVTVWSDKNTDFQGTITARGGILGGDGGFIETSAQDNLNITGTVNASAINGNAGTWLIDPTNITITNSEGGDIGDSTVNVANINSALDNGTNVEITTNIGGTDEGNITQETGTEIDWSTSAFLTLDANNDITLNPNSSITARGAGEVNLNAARNITLNNAIIRSQNGDTKIDTGSLFLTDGAQIGSSTFGQGDGGVIEITAKDTISLSSDPFRISRILSEVEEEAIGNGGGIKIDTDSLSLTGGAQIGTSTRGQGDGGVIEITAKDTISLSGTSQGRGALVRQSGIFSDVIFQKTQGNGGGIKIDTGSLSLTDGAQIGSSTYGQGNAGAIEITAKDTIFLSGQASQGLPFPSAISSGISSSNLPGNTGNIKIDTGSLSLTDSAEISSRNRGQGNTGAIEIIAKDTISLSGESQGFGFTSRIFSEGSLVGIQEVAGGIKITTGSLSLTDGTEISASNRGQQGNAGEIKITTVSLSMANDTKISSITLGQGNAGDITLTAGDSLLLSEINSFSLAEDPGNSSGNGGDITLIAEGNISIQDLNSFSFGQDNSGNGGNITIQTREGNISFNGSDESPSVINSFSVAENGNSGNGGNISIITNGNFNNAEIVTLSSSGESGTVNIETPSNLSLNNVLVTTSQQVTVEYRDEFDEIKTVTLDIDGNTGQSGDFFINTQGNLTLNNSNIQADTKGTNPAGDVTLTSRGTTTLNNTIINSQTSAQGNAGNITFKTPNLVLNNGVTVSATTSGMGSGGTITIENSDNVILDTNSQLTVETSAAGTPGDINITTDTLSVGKDAQLSATATATSTNTEGGGSINLNASNLNISGKLGVFAETQGIAPAGNLTITTNNNNPNLNIQFSDQGFISASTSGSGQGGNIDISAPNAIDIQGDGTIKVETSGTGNAGSINIIGQQLNLSNGISISASTDSRGQGGSVTINAPQFVSLNQALLLTQASSTGAAGNLTVKTGRMSVSDGSKVTVSSSQGLAGELTINTNFLSLNQGTITAETSQSGGEEGAKITLKISDLLRIENESRISATAKGSADGGNININTPLLLVFPPTGSNGSDIIANAETGNGGKITINAQGIFGIAERPAIPHNQSNDIDASSEFGTSGQVEIDNTIDPNRGLIELPETVVDPNALIAQNPCKRGSESEFVITGRGGLPPSLSEDLSSDATQVDLVEPAPIESREAEDKTSSSPSVPTTIIPAQGWVFNEQGEIVLVAYNPTVTGSQRLKENPASCSIP